MTLPDPTLPWPIPMAGVALVAEFEGCRLSAYKCPAGIWTCGWGETDGVTPRTKWTKAYADQRFCESLTERAEAVKDLCIYPATDNQLAALTSLSYNIGVAGLRGSTVLKCHNRGDEQAAARAFGLWNKARVNGALAALPGLTRRRAAEAALYLKPDDEASLDRMPQAVESEAPLASSPIARSGAAAGTVGVLALAQEVGGQVESVAAVAQTVRSVAVDTVGVPPGLFLPLVLVAAGAVAWWWRAKQRKDGWA